jgi:hypothetical protein
VKLLTGELSMWKMYHYSNEGFGRIKKSSFLHGKTWYMGNIVLKKFKNKHLII